MIVTLNEILMENGTLNGSMTEICREDFDLNINSAIPKLPTHTVQAFPCDRTRTPPHTPEEPKTCDSSHA